MTSRRGRSSGSGQPGTRAWRESIQSIKQELNASNGQLIGILEEQEAEKAEEVQPLFDLAESLRVQELLSYMNDTILDGQGVIQTILRWEEGVDLDDEDFEDEEGEWDDEEDEEDDEDEEEEGTPYLFVVLTVMLSWKEAGRLQIKVDFQEDEDEGMEVQVNGWVVSPPSARNLQSGLVRAFREQMAEDYGQFEEE